MSNSQAALQNDAEKIVTNPVKAIRKYCLDCCGNSANEVNLCPAVKCFLHPFRLGKNPYRTKRVMTDEQRAEATERLAKARRNRQDTQNA